LDVVDSWASGVWSPEAGPVSWAGPVVHHLIGVARWTRAAI